MSGLRFAAVLLMLSIGGFAFAAESRQWDLQIVVGAPAAEHDRILDELHKAAIAKGLTRTPAAAGIDELVGRKVVLFSYGLCRSDPLLMITDVKNPRELLVWAFLDEAHPGFVESIVSAFLSEVRTIEGVTIKEQRR